MQHHVILSFAAGQSRSGMQRLLAAGAPVPSRQPRKTVQLEGLSPARARQMADKLERWNEIDNVQVTSEIPF